MMPIRESIALGDNQQFPGADTEKQSRDKKATEAVSSKTVMEVESKRIDTVSCKWNEDFFLP